MLCPILCLHNCSCEYFVPFIIKTETPALWSSFFSSFLWCVSCILFILSFWTKIHLSVSIYHACSFVFELPYSGWHSSSIHLPRNFMNSLFWIADLFYWLCSLLYRRFLDLRLWATGVQFRKFPPVPMSSWLLLTFFSIRLSVSGCRSKSLIHLDLSFV